MADLVQLPTVRDAFAEARQRELQRAWTPVVYNARMAIGVSRLIQTPEREIYPVFRKRYLEMCAKVLNGEPLPHKCYARSSGLVGGVGKPLPPVDAKPDPETGRAFLKDFKQMLSNQEDCVMQVVLNYCPETGELRNKRGTVIVQWMGLEDCALDSAQETDMVNHPPHYTQHPSGVECIDLSEHLPANLSHAFKYLWRAGLKGGKAKGPEDKAKALFYLRRQASLLQTGRKPPLVEFLKADDDVLLLRILDAGFSNELEDVIAATQMLEEGGCDAKA